MTTTEKEESWEKEYMKRFVMSEEDDSGSGLIYYMEETCNPFELKLFIKKLLSHQQEGLIRKIEGLIPPVKYTGYGAWSPKGMHLDDHKRNFIKEVVALIKEQSNGK